MTKDLRKPTESNTLSRPTWKQTWMSVAETIALRSQCSKAQVGCVIVDEDQQVLAASYNGPPPGTNYAGPCSGWCKRAITGESTPDYSNCPSSHAEINAIARMPQTTKPKTIYINRMCCFTCAKAIASASIKNVIYLDTSIDEHLNINDTVTFLNNAGIYVERSNATTTRDTSTLC